MNNFPSCFRRGPAVHQMVQGQGVVNPRDRRLPLGLFPESRTRWTDCEMKRVLC
jgi:hypothetical protein